MSVSGCLYMTMLTTWTCGSIHWTQQWDTGVGSGTSQWSTRLIDCLPRSTQVCIIFTTRNKKVAVKLAEANIIELSELDEGTATELLKKLLARSHLVENQHDVNALLADLTYLPLGIVQAAAHIQDSQPNYRLHLRRSQATISRIRRVQLT
jgi:hypothetical protein